MDGKYLGLTDGKESGGRVLLAMSGGVDSGVAAIRLKEAGYEVIGLTMKNYCYGDAEVPDKSCCSLAAIDDARSVCNRVGIRHLVTSTEEIFGREVYDNFLHEYSAGRTPNPCVRCNSIVRFDVLLDFAARLDVAYIATGHYARVFQSSAGHLYLARSKHMDKDQSYFLAGLRRDDLDRVIFPLGDDHKQEVREVARAATLDIADKPESQDICFVPDGTIREFLDGKVPMTPGDIENTSGDVVGRHEGLASYTVGQRRGLGVSVGHPIYVARLDVERNVLVVGEDDELMTTYLRGRINWVDRDVVAGNKRLAAQIRSRQSAQLVEKVEFDGDDAHVHFAEPQRAVAPGQTVAFYDGDVVVGSGVIESAGEPV